MFGLILLYWIGKYYYKLAEKYNRNKWLFVILGIAVYYLGMILFGIIIMSIAEMISPGYIDTSNEALFSIFMVPFGALSCYLIYNSLKNNWKGDELDSVDEIGNK